MGTPTLASTTTTRSRSKASATTIAGTADSTHEKLTLSVGTRTLYAQGGDGATYRLRVTVDGTSAVTIAVARKSS